MLKVVTASLCKTPSTRSLLAFSTCSVLSQEAIKIYEAPKIDNEIILALPEKKHLAELEEIYIQPPAKLDISPIAGVPREHVYTRRIRIYQSAKNVMQSGPSNIHWEMEFDNRQRWENPLMGWTSTGDPLSNLQVRFLSCEKAVEHCEKMGWQWYLDVPKKERPFRLKNYSINFSWNRRTRVSTK